jgi:hypothetical protein
VRTSASFSKSLMLRKPFSKFGCTFQYIACTQDYSDHIRALRVAVLAGLAAKFSSCKLSDVS